MLTMVAATAAPAAAPVAADARARCRALAGCSLFASLSAASLEALASAMTERQVECGEEIFRQGDPGSALFAVLSGEVRIVVGGDDGRDHVLRIAGPGEVFGEISVFDGRARSADAIAATRCRLLVLDRRHLLALMAREPEVANRLIGVLCEKLRATSAQVESLLFHSLSKRLATVLLDLLGNRRGPSIDITQTELGRLTGVTRESVNKKLRAWQAAGFVSLQPGRVIVLVPDALRRC
jgi:CRP-like cAMP-binding protein